MRRAARADRNHGEAVEALPPMSDEKLLADLAAIDDEVQRRKKARPFEPYATWALLARNQAIAEFAHRWERV